MLKSDTQVRLYNYLIAAIAFLTSAEYIVDILVTLNIMIQDLFTVMCNNWLTLSNIHIKRRFTVSGLSSSRW